VESFYDAIIPDWRIKWLYLKDDIQGRVLEKEDPMMLWQHPDCRFVENVENQKNHIGCVAVVVNIKEERYSALTPT